MDSHFSADEHFRRGCDALERDDYAVALEHFRDAQRVDPHSPRYRSYYGLCLGVSQRRFDQALELCRSAAKEEFFNPELYRNLAQVHLAFGFKAEGIRFLRRGLMIDPDNELILADMRALGVRRRQVFALVMLESGLLSALGIALGLALAVPLVLWLEGHPLPMTALSESAEDVASLFGIEPVVMFRLTPWHWGALPLLLLGLALLASIPPALRACRGRPADALRTL